MTDEQYKTVLSEVKEWPLWMKIGFTLYGEARNQSYDAQIEVAKVMLRRQRDKLLWNDIISPWQFSCWNRDDPNLPVMLGADIRKDTVIRKCIEIAVFVIEHITNKDLVATHYHDLSLKPEIQERVFGKMEHIKDVGAFKFYQEAKV